MSLGKFVLNVIVAVVALTVLAPFIVYWKLGNNRIERSNP
jgi:hypothetical protein